MFRTIGDGPSPWESLLPPELRRLPEELARVDALLDDPVFFAPFAPYFHPVLGRPSTPAEWYLRLMLLKFRYRLGFESRRAEVSDSISWRRFCRIPLDGRVPHPATLMKLTTRCGADAGDGLNEALWAKAAGHKLLQVSRLRADTTVVPAKVAYPADSGLLARAVRRIAATGRRVRAAGGPRGPGCATAAARPAGGSMRSRRSCGHGPRRPTTTSRPWWPGRPGSWPGWPSTPPPSRSGCWLMRAGRCAAPRRRPRRWPRPGSPTLPRGGCAAGCAGRSMTWPRCWRRPGPSPRRPGSGWPARCPAGRPGGSACTTATPARSPRAASASLSSSGTRRRSLTTTTGSSPTTPSSQGNPADGPQLPPAVQRVIKRAGNTPVTVTADRSDGEQAIDDDLHALGVRHVVIPRKGKPGKARQ